jgi:hypothetical protein
MTMQDEAVCAHLFQALSVGEGFRPPSHGAAQAGIQYVPDTVAQ